MCFEETVDSKSTKRNTAKVVLAKKRFVENIESSQAATSNNENIESSQAATSNNETSVPEKCELREYFSKSETNANEVITQYIRSLFGKARMMEKNGEYIVKLKSLESTFSCKGDAQKMLALYDENLKEIMQFASIVFG